MTKVKKLSDKVTDILDDCGWRIADYTDDGHIEIESKSPAGEDLIICLDVGNFANDLFQYAEDFDEEEHVEELLEAKRNGLRGVPSAAVLVQDTKDIKLMLRELSTAVVNFAK